MEDKIRCDSREGSDDEEEGALFLKGVTVDEVLKRVGGYRRWHLLAFVLLGFTGMGLNAFHNLAIVFIGRFCHASSKHTNYQLSKVLYANVRAVESCGTCPITS